MSKRKPAMASKHAHSPRMAAKAQRAAQAIVRSPKKSAPHSGGPSRTEPLPKRHNESQQDEDALLVENPELLVENPDTASKDDAKQIADNHSKKGTNFSLANANMRAYQAKLLEIAQANMQFAFEFAQRLATIRSPVEFPSFIAEFTSRRMTMFRKHSTEMAELSTKQWTS
jgi:hypothetical protein